MNPAYAKAYNNRGTVYLNKGYFDRAIRDYNQAIKLNPRDVTAYYNRGNAYLSKGDYESAIRDFDKAIGLNPRMAAAYNNRGSVYNRRGEHERAIRDFDQAIELNPRYAKAYNNRGLAYIGQGNYERAIRDFERVIKLNPGNAKAYDNLAWILATHPDAELRDGSQAVRLAERACHLTQYKSPAMLDTLAATYAETGRFDQAVKTAQKAMQIARAAKSEKLAEDIQSRLNLYKAKRPFRTSALEGSGPPPAP